MRDDLFAANGDRVALARAGDEMEPRHARRRPCGQRVPAAHRRGQKPAAHTHSGCEITQVLYGAIHDGRERFAAGDFDDADGSVHHGPVVALSDECICLASMEGRVAFDGRIARMLGSLVGI